MNTGWPGVHTTASEYWPLLAREAEDCLDDLQALGIWASVNDAAARCGVDVHAALLGLVWLHQKLGRSAGETAASLGVTPRTVVRYRTRIRRYTNWPAA